MNDALPSLKKNNKMTLPLLLVAGTMMLVLFVIMPQFSAISEIRQSILEKEARITVLNDSLQVLAASSDEEVDDSFSTVHNALPNNKNVIAIFSAFSDAAQRSEVTIEGFSFEVGGIYRKENSTDVAEVVSDVRGVPSLQVTLNLIAPSETELTTFVDFMQKSLPLAEVKTLRVTDGIGNIQVNFFYQTYDVAQLNSLDEIPQIDAQSKQTLEMIQSWENQ